MDDVTIEAVSAGEERAQQALDEVRLGVERNVFRGQMISFSGNVFGPRVRIRSWRPAQLSGP